MKTDLITHSYPIIGDFVEEEGIRLHPVSDIAAMKLNAIAGNGTRSKDFIDIYFLMEKFSVEQLLYFYKEKYRQRNVFHVVKSLVYFDDISLSDWPVMLQEKNLDLETIKKRFIAATSEYGDAIF